MRAWTALGITGLTLAAGCTAINGPKPVDRNGIVVSVAANTSADAVADAFTQTGAEFGILAGPRDSAFFAGVATRANLQMTRPGHAGPMTFAFLGPKAVGDTTLSLKVQGGGELRLHDALYTIDKHRLLDMMAVRIEPNSDLENSVKALLAYIATDVGANAAVLLAIDAPSESAGDSVSVLTRAAFSDLRECVGDKSIAPPPLRVFYGPAVRMTCSSARRLAVGNGAIFGHFVLPR